MKLWGGAFTKATDKLVEEYNASITFDYLLMDHDITGSIAHVRMLSKCGLIPENEAELIKKGLEKIQDRINEGEVSLCLSDEDIHMNIERLLHEEIGEIAGKLHTGRSRNDQVALDMHLYLRHEVVNIIQKLSQLLRVFYNLAKEHIGTIFPGYTHLQRAEPVRFAHHMLAYFNMFSRDIDRLCDSYKRINLCPLGAGALAGSGVNINPEFTANLLGFEGVYTNSLDAVSDRDFIVEFLSIASLIMMHFSKLSEELILWNSHEFSFIKLDDAFCTGSSMMPQKKNPDVCELARGKTGRVYGALLGVLTMLKGLPLAYNKDLQEDKEGVFDVVKTLKQTLSVYVPMLATMTVNKEIMREAIESDYANATNLANYLVNKNIPFRVAHELSGKIVQYGIEKKVLLKDLTLHEYTQFCPRIDNDVYSILTIDAVVEAHTSTGGTSQRSVETQLQNGLKRLSEIETWIQNKIF